MFALARRIAAAAQRHAEAGEHQATRERAHGIQIAAQQRLRIGEEIGLIVRKQSERRLPVGLVQQ